MMRINWLSIVLALVLMTASAASAGMIVHGTMATGADVKWIFSDAEKDLMAANASDDFYLSFTAMVSNVSGTIEVGGLYGLLKLYSNAEAFGQRWASATWGTQDNNSSIPIVNDVPIVGVVKFTVAPNTFTLNGAYFAPDLSKTEGENSGTYLDGTRTIAATMRWIDINQGGTANTYTFEDVTMYYGGDTPFILEGGDIPEPATMGLLAVGGGLALLRRRRK